MFGQIEPMNSRERVVSILSKCSGISADRIGLPDSLTRNLGIAGDDGVHLIIGISNEFGTDFSNFDSLPWFGPEGVLFDIGKNYNEKSKSDHSKFTVEHLIKVVELGYWFEPA